jgi:predicted enzyme related to lactoylglutathione lyase
MTDIEVLFAGVAVADFEAAVTWYVRLFGRPADIVVKDDEVMWRIADTAWLYVVGDEQRAGRALVTLSVSDLDEALREIRGRGIASGPVELVGTAGRKASFTDTEGNTLSFIEVASSRSSLRD